MFMLETASWPFLPWWCYCFWSRIDLLFKDYILVQAGYMKVALARFYYDKYTQPSNWRLLLHKITHLLKENLVGCQGTNITKLPRLFQLKLL